MFSGKKESAEALVLSREQIGSTRTTTASGDVRSEHEFVVEVRPVGEPPFQATIRDQISHLYSPRVNEVVRVTYRAKDRQTAFDLDGDPRYEEPDRKAQNEFVQRSQRLLDEIFDLQKNGPAADAYITDVRVISVMAINRELSVTATIDPPDRPTYSATFPMIGNDRTLPAVGDTIRVSIDRTDPSRVRMRPAEAEAPAPQVLWSVPFHCPNCGAPVDQSRASQAAHPTCPTCQAPLPSTPA